MKRRQASRPTDNIFVARFNRRLRVKGVRSNWFLSLADARARIEAWRRDYDESRPHTAVAGRRKPNMLHPLGLTSANAGHKLASCPDEKPGHRRQGADDRTAACEEDFKRALKMLKGAVIDGQAFVAAPGRPTIFIRSLR